MNKETAIISPEGGYRRGQQDSVDNASDHFSSSSSHHSRFPRRLPKALRRRNWLNRKIPLDDAEMSSSDANASPRMKVWFLWTHNPERPATGQPDFKLACVGTDLHTQDSIISLHHARLLGLIPPPTAENNYDMVDNNQDSRVEVAWVGKGQEGGIMRCKVSNDARYDLILGGEFISMHALFNERPGKAPTELGRSLDASFRPIDPTKRRNFFKRGIVIRILWPQPQPYDGHSREGIFKVDGWTEKVHYKITWFVVIQVFKAHCIALPIHTYGGQGTTKPGVDPSNYAALILKDDEDKPLPGEGLVKSSFRMILETSIDLNQTSRIDFSKPSTIEYNTKVMKVGRIVAADVGRLLDYFLRTSSKVNTKLFSVPHPRNVDFFGREEQLDQLSRALAPSKEHATNPKVGIVLGMGGIGKTELTLEFIYRNQAIYDAIFWVDSRDDRSILTEFERIDSELNHSCPLGTDGNPVERVRQWLTHPLHFAAESARRSNFQWLLVFDNIGSLDLLRQFIPPSTGAAVRGTILLTSRNIELATATTFCMRLDAFSKDEGTTFLKRLICNDSNDDDEMAATAAIVDRLQGLPLAIAKTREYVNRHRMPLSYMLQLFETSTFSEKNSFDYTRALSDSLLFGIKQLSVRSRKFLAMLSYLDPAGIPNILEENTSDYQSACMELIQYSLIHIDNHRIQIHRLLQDAMRSHVERNSNLEPFCLVAELVASVYTTTSPAVQEWIPHAVSLRNHFMRLQQYHEWAEEEYLRVSRAMVPVLVHLNWRLLMTRNTSESDQTMMVLCTLVHPEVILRAHGIVATITGEECWIPLDFAASEGYLDLVQSLLDMGPQVNSCNEQFRTALHTASFAGHEAIVRLLLDVGADVNAQSERFGTALHAASFAGHKAIVQLLLNVGADVNAKSERFGSASLCASYAGHLDIVRFLLNAGADVNAQSERFGTALHAASFAGHKAIVQLLLNVGAYVNAQSERFGSALLCASYTGHLDIVRFLLNAGADVNAQSERFGSALLCASYAGHLDIVQVLLEAGADPNVQGPLFGGALQTASPPMGRFTTLRAVPAAGHKSIVKLRMADSTLDKSTFGAALVGKHKADGINMDSRVLPAATMTRHDKVIKIPPERTSPIYWDEFFLSDRPALQANAETVTGRLTHADYTVAWLCALPVERDAAISMLDNQHESLPVPPQDHHTYILGSIGSHNIVIPDLPERRIHNSAISTVVPQMLKTFPAVRMSLFVGIGGGIPPRVRVGDVVISMPSSTNTGVVQWELEPEISGVFKLSWTTGLGKTSESLNMARSAMERDAGLYGYKIEKYVEQLKERWPRLASKFQRPTAANEVLFKAEYDHVEEQISQSGLQSNLISRRCQDSPGGMNWGSCQYCDRNQTVELRPRENISLHYGLIASGDRVVKDALFRDILNKEFGGKVLCVEMEAIGVPQNLPSLVIRGICDYADSHKNDHWQAYAAATAAAYTKELLRNLPPSEVIKEAPVNLVARKGGPNGNRQPGQQTMSRLIENDHELLDWITRVDFRSQQMQILREWHQGSGRWLLASREFQKWLQTRREFLYCQGIPGVGKTVLTAAVIQHIEAQFSNDINMGFAYIYCNFSRHKEQTLDYFLATLTRQLVQRQFPPPGTIRKYYNSHKTRGTRPTTREFSSMLRSALSSFDRTFIVIDALDECGVNVRGGLMSEVLDLQTSYDLNVLVTSRPVGDMAAACDHGLHLPIISHQEDVESYLRSRMHKHNPDLFDIDFRRIVTAHITETAENMFLLAKLQINVLIDFPTQDDVLRGLNNLVKGAAGLEAIYNQLLDRSLQQQSGPLAKRILQWILHARRPLTVLELQHAVAIRPATKTLNREFIPSLKSIESCCAGLVVIDELDNGIRLIHYTLHEYLTKNWGKWFADPEIEISTACLTYLSFHTFADGPCKSDEELRSRLQRYPFYDYAACNWGHHARAASDSQAVLPFLNNQPQVQASIQVLLTEVQKQRRGNRDLCQDPLPEFTALHLAAYFGLLNVTASISKSGQIDPQDYWGRTPLWYAVDNGWEAVVEFLLENNAEPDVRDVQGQTLLSIAAKRDSAAIMKMLLDKHADPESPDRNGRTPLSWAAEYGGQAVIQLLLLNGKVDPGSQDRNGMTPLYWATKVDTAAALILARGINPTYPDSEIKRERRSQFGWYRWYLLRPLGNEDWTPLFWAAARGWVGVVHRLLNTNTVDINVQDEMGRTAEDVASENGHKAVVRLLQTARVAGENPEMVIDDDWDEPMGTSPEGSI
ncbi:hypothetical protein GGR58DRAFT_520462 [Xylaria digitata]|nr:hypothetical protein GGR58DRAFT_520462 [Xylaria digitata]